MQNSQCWNFAVQSGQDGIEMLRALRQHEDLTALLVRILDLRRNCGGPVMEIAPNTSHAE